MGARAAIAALIAGAAVAVWAGTPASAAQDVRRTIRLDMMCRSDGRTGAFELVPGTPRTYEVRNWRGVDTIQLCTETGYCSPLKVGSFDVVCDGGALVRFADLFMASPHAAEGPFVLRAGTIFAVHERETTTLVERCRPGAAECRAGTERRVGREYLALPDGYAPVIEVWPISVQVPPATANTSPPRVVAPKAIAGGMTAPARLMAAGDAGRETPPGPPDVLREQQEWRTTTKISGPLRAQPDVAGAKAAPIPMPGATTIESIAASSQPLFGKKNETRWLGILAGSIGLLVAFALLLVMLRNRRTPPLYGLLRRVGAAFAEQRSSHAVAVSDDVARVLEKPMRTPFLEVWRDSQTGLLEGMILEGEAAGRKLSSLAVFELILLWREVASDLASRVLVEAMLDARRPFWRDTVGERGPSATPRRDPPQKTEVSLTVEEALAILGFKGSAIPTRDEIAAKWRALAKKLHPDLDGSEHLIKQVNSARALLQAKGML